MLWFDKCCQSLGDILQIHFHVDLISYPAPNADFESNLCLINFHRGMKRMGD